MTLNYTATCLFGLEGLLGEEIESLGYKRIENMDGRITFEGDENAAARCSINLRFAERLYLHVGSFTATTFTELFDGTKDLPWENYIGRDDEFPVSGHSIKSKLFSVPDCQKIIKKATSVRLGEKYNLARLPETGTRYKIEFFLFKDKANLMIDLSGAPLHKRGYRPETVDAPIRETLAAAMVKLARPRENVLLWDPFCGSGTIAIEAAMMMKNIAPGLKRTFVAENYPIFPSESWTAAREEAESKINHNTQFEAYATDINDECVRIAEESARRAGVADMINIFKMDALDIDTLGRRGTIVTNPPYGDRLLTLEEAESLYRAMGQAFASLEKWQIYVITQSENFPKLYGRRADKIRKLYNGMIPCYYYQFFKNQDAKK
ncbi:MAG: class I SAM-dependent RNA methyltransferase [Ruminococcaceae bacterium]|nr:class I SAM-dependent RNA methyltransferase [Oscillospiraceae bacterium]